MNFTPSQEKQIRALVNLHGYSRRNAEERVMRGFVKPKEKRVKKNPARKNPTEVHVDINSHNARKSARAKTNPKKRTLKSDLSTGDAVRYNIPSGFGDAVVINPHENANEYSFTQSGKEYDKNGHPHVRQVTIKTSRGYIKTVPEYSVVKTNPVQKKLQSRPKPSGRLNKRVFTVEMKHGDEWRTEGIFPTETSAREYARALDAKHGHAKYIRVTV